jgi:hypothetical protein
MSKDKEPDALAELRANIIAAAAEAIVGQMTPQMMRKTAEALLEKILGEIGTNEYSDLGRMIKEKSMAAMRDYLASDHAKSQIHASVVQGVNAALEGMSEGVKGQVIDTALKGMVSALEGRNRR